MSDQNPTQTSADDSARYANNETNSQDNAERYTSDTNDEALIKEEHEEPALAADLTAMVEHINADLTTLYQEINQHINEQLEQVKSSRQDIDDLMTNLGKQLKNTQKK